MTDRTPTTYINLPTLAGAAIGDRVSGHWAQADREDGIITEIKGERAKLTFTLKSGNQSWQWVRSCAPVSASRAISAAKAVATKNVKSKAYWLTEQRLWLERTKREGKAIPEVIASLEEHLPVIAQCLEEALAEARAAGCSDSAIQRAMDGGTEEAKHWDSKRLG